MLTKQDLQAIDNLLAKRTDEIVTKHINPIKKDIVKIQKDINLIVSFFDREHTNLRRRVSRIEDHLHLPALSS
jgi:hypothetical protein